MIRSRVVALTSLYLLVVCAVGMLHPVRNALVLDTLGGSGFYKVYVASALVAVAIVPFGRLAARVPQRRLTPAVAIFFAINLVLFRVVFPGGVVFGVLFYAWHDLYAGILVSQFFLATAAMLDPRSAKATYPWIVAAGSVGAAIGGAVTGFLTPAIGVANLLLIAAALTTIFAFAMPVVTRSTESAVQPNVRPHDETTPAPIHDVLGNPQVRLIAVTVVLTVLVKQLVDYQFNAATATLGDRDAISAFQGKFNALTQWFPLVAAMAIRPAIARWGVGAALLMLPASMIVTNIILGLRGGLGPAAVTKGTETTLRYSAERTGREILYIPVSEEVRARAKPLIDVGLESGVAKASSAAVIFVLLATLGATRLAWASVVLSIIWLGFAVAERRAYVRSLAAALRVPAGFAEISVTLSDSATREVVRHALAEGDPTKVGFVLDLLAHAAPADVQALIPELRALQAHADPTVRSRAAGLTGAGPREQPDPASASIPTRATASGASKLASTLRDQTSDLRARRTAARELRMRGGPEAVAALLGAAADDTLELGLRTDALRALRRLRDDDPATRIEHDVVDAVVTEHLDAAERYAVAGAAFRDERASDERDRLLQRAIVEAWQTRQGAVFDGLSVILDSRVVDGCYHAIIGTDERYRAEALELIEESGSRQAVRRLDPILRPEPDYDSLGVAGPRGKVVASLRSDDDPWVAQCAAYRENAGRGKETTMHVIERVFLLQRVDVFAGVPSHHLARIALLAHGVDADAGAVLLRATEVADAMYVVVDGELRATFHDRLSRSFGAGEGVGSLALLDDVPLGVDIRVMRPSHLLRLTRRDLGDLLQDHPELAVSLLQGVATRLRSLVEARPALVGATPRPTRA